MNNLRKLIRDTRGANLVEYIILTGVIAIAVYGAAQALGSNVQDKFDEAGDKIGNMAME